MSFDPVSYAMGTKAAGGGGGGTPEVLVCTFTKSGNTISCDKTGAEIVAAYNAGMEVIGLADYDWASAAGNIAFGDAVVRLTRVGYNSGTANMLTFTGDYFFPGDSVTPDESGVFVLYGLTLLGSWRWAAAYVPASSLPSVTTSDNGKVLGVSGGAWGAEDRSPLVVTYTITGGSDSPYTLSYSHTLSQIAAAQTAGREVIGYININGVPVSAPAIVRAAAAGKMVYSGVAYMGAGAWMSVQVDHSVYNDEEGAWLYLASLNTTTMRFDSATGTLYINNVPEVQSGD